MTHSAKKFTYALTVILVALLSLISSILGGGARIARAAVTTSNVERYESANVWDDLQGTKIDGKDIDFTLYNFDEKKNVQLVSFVEFGYSYQKDKQSDYGLYVYVYNPRGYDWTKNTEKQNIKMCYGGNSSANFGTYSLKFLNRSENAGYEGLFYKFKVILSDRQRADVLAGVNSAGRIYEVSEIELCSIGRDLTAYDISNKYTYTGFAQGYGSESATSDSLNCTSDGLMTLSLDVHAAAYRPDDTNGKPYTQDTLHSVYFSIPNKIINEYGGLSAVHAMWLNVKTAPLFVTGNETVFNDIYEQIEDNYGELKDNTQYALLVNGKNIFIGQDGYSYSADSAYNVDDVAWYCSGTFGTQYYGVDLTTPKLNNLYYAFLADNGNADGYELKGEMIIEYLKYFTEKITSEVPPTSSSGDSGDNNTGNDDRNPSGENGDGTGGSVGGGFGGGGGHGRSASTLVAGKYNPVLFESYDSEYTDKNIKATDTYSLTNTKLSQSFWEKLMGKPGTQVEYSKTFDNIEAIHPIMANDFRNTVAATCKRLYINESYYADFKAFYDSATKADETVFLFRYYQSEYVSKEVTEFERRTDIGTTTILGGKVALKKLDTNAYMAQEVLNLDFDIIDVTCTKGNVSTVIANVMSPIDIAPDLTPPLDTTPEPEEKPGFNFWEWLSVKLGLNVKDIKIIFGVVVGVLALALILGILTPFIPGLKVALSTCLTGLGTLFKWLLIGIGWLIALPFRLIATPFKSIKRRVEERKRRNEILHEEKISRKDQMTIERYQNKLDRKELKYQGKLDKKDKEKAQKQKERKRRKTANKKGKKK